MYDLTVTSSGSGGNKRKGFGVSSLSSISSVNSSVSNSGSNSSNKNDPFFRAGPEKCRSLPQFLTAKGRVAEEFEPMMELTDAELEEVGKCLPHNDVLHTLNLWYKKIGEKGATILSPFLSDKDCTLSSLVLTGCDLGPAGAVQILSSFVINPSHLTKLFLANNKITDEGLEQMTRLVNPTPPLNISTLILGTNRLGDASVIGLCTAIASGALPQLKELDLSYNNISDGGAMALAKCFRYHSEVQELYIRNNSIAQEGFFALSDLLRTCTPLKTLNMLNNTETEDGPWEIYQSVLFNPIITILELNIKAKKTAKDVVSKLEANTAAAQQQAAYYLSEKVVDLPIPEKTTWLCVMPNLMLSMKIHSPFVALTHLTMDNYTFLTDLTTKILTASFSTTFPALTHLSIANCGVEDLGVHLAASTTLIDLIIANNPIATPPKLPSTLKYLNARGCPFLAKIPVEIRVQKKRDGIIAYINDIANAEPIFKAKLLVMGAGGVGKSNLVDEITPKRGTLDVHVPAGIFRRLAWRTKSCEITLGFFRFPPDFAMPLKDAKVEILDERRFVWRITASTGSVTAAAAANGGGRNERQSSSLPFVMLRSSSKADMESWIVAVKRKILNSATDTLDLRPWRISREELVLAGCYRPSIPFIECTVWDFAGQETYLESHQFFISRRSIFLVIVDLSPKHSNDTVHSGNRSGREQALQELSTWLVMLETLIGGKSGDNDCHLVIVGNKFDLINNRDDFFMQRSVEIQRIYRQSGLSLSYTYMEVSCKTGYNIDYLRNHIIFTMSELQSMGELVPVAYHKVKDFILARKSSSAIAPAPAPAPASESAQAETLNPTPPTATTPANPTASTSTSSPSSSSSSTSLSKYIVDLSDVCKCVGLDSGLVKRLLFLLHHWSECVFFEETDGELNGLVFLDAVWLSKKVIGSLLFFLGGTVGELSSAEQQDLIARKGNTTKDGRHVTFADLRAAWHWCSDEAVLLACANLLSKFSIMFPRNAGVLSPVSEYFVPGAFPMLKLTASSSSSSASSSSSPPSPSPSLLSSISTATSWRLIGFRVISVNVMVTGLTAQLCGSLREDGFDIHPDLSLRTSLVVSSPSSQTSKRERCLIILDVAKKEMGIRVETQNPASSSSSSSSLNDFIGSELLDDVVQSVVRRLGRYTGLVFTLKYCCPTCLLDAEAGMEGVEARWGASVEAAALEDAGHRRIDDGIICVKCLAKGHAVPLYKYFCDVRRTKCLQHGVTHHDFFISYRVHSDADTAMEVCMRLENTGGFQVFLDKRCLANGEDWRQSFLTGLHHSATIVLLLSAASMKTMKRNVANKVVDNVLLEIIEALKQRGELKARVIPVTIINCRKNVEEEDDGDDSTFNFFDLDWYDVKEPIVQLQHHQQLPQSPPQQQQQEEEVTYLRSVMELLFKLQCIKIFVTKETHQNEVNLNELVKDLRRSVNE